MTGFTSTTYPYDPAVGHDLSKLEGAATGELYVYWLAKKGDQPVPQWVDFQFMDLYRIAPVMAVLDVDPSRDAGKLRYRFFGTKVVEYRRHRKYPDLTGKTFEEADRTYVATAMHDAYSACIRTARPVIMTGEYQTDQSWGFHERIILPWLIDGEVARLTNALDRFPKNNATP